MFLWVALPLCGLTGANAYYREAAHAAHLAEHPPARVEYPYMNIPGRRFPWGDGKHTLFHNPKLNGP